MFDFVSLLLKIQFLVEIHLHMLFHV
jgi:hypothetical protein